MGAFRDAIDEELRWGETWNGQVKLNSSGSALLDFFALAGSLRSASVYSKLDLFDAAFKEDPDSALKLLFYTRDVRGGYGERDTFNEIFSHLAGVRKESVIKNLWGVLEFGRAKDLYCLIGTDAEEAMWDFMKNQFDQDLENLAAGNSISLLAKWIATPDSSSEKTKALGVLTAKKLGYDFKSMREYKKQLRALRKHLDLPEARMAAREWSSIEYSRCASRALLTHKEAFKRHDPERYDTFIDSVRRGEASVCVGALTPYDLFHRVVNGDSASDVDVLWDNLPDVNGGNVLVVCDTSGSMWGRYRASVMPGEVAFALTIYFSERNKGDLKDVFMTFSSKPEFVELKGSTLQQKYRTLYRTEWGHSTNLEVVFELLLRMAKKSGMKKDFMPEAILIISDMQVDCVHGVERERITFYDSMKQRFEREGFSLPSVVFWNVNAMNPTFHASAFADGVSMVSGYSTNVFQQVLDSIGSTPYDLMMKVINNTRYSGIKA